MPLQICRRGAPLGSATAGHPQSGICFRSASLDESPALGLFEQLGGMQRMFIVHMMAMGIHWAERIDREMRQVQPVRNEMVE